MQFQVNPGDNIGGKNSVMVINQRPISLNIDHGYPASDRTRRRAFFCRVIFCGKGYAEGGLIRGRSVAGTVLHCLKNLGAVLRHKSEKSASLFPDNYPAFSDNYPKKRCREGESRAGLGPDECIPWQKKSVRYFSS